MDEIPIQSLLAHLADLGVLKAKPMRGIGMDRLERTAQIGF
jgi:hypothetical protein